MLTPEQVKPLLKHPDRHVRESACRYLHDCWSPDPELVPLVLEISAQDSPTDLRPLLRWCDHFVMTEPALNAILAEAARTTSDSLRYDYGHLLRRAPLELVEAHRAQLEEAARMLPDLSVFLDQCRKLAGWSGEQLWQELQDFAARSEEFHHVGEIDHTYANLLVETLARYPVPDTPTLCRLLEAESDGGWLETFLVDLAGARRLREAVPALVKKYHIDTDYLLERCSDALGRIQDPEAVRLIRAEYPTAEDNFRNFTSSTLSRVKHPESEEAILALLEVEKDFTYRTFLCSGLCDLFSERGVPVVLREIQAGYDTELVHLEEELLPLLDALGLSLPQMTAWRRKREESDRRFQQSLRQMDEWRKKQAAAPAPPKKLPQPLPPPLPPPLLAPVARKPVRVGRNDPCPCGSGKKFKNCCLPKS